MTQEEKVAIANEFLSEHDTTWGRQSELSGLTLEDVDTKEEIIEICEQALDVNAWVEEEDEDDDNWDDDNWDDEDFEDEDEENNEDDEEDDDDEEFVEN